MLRPLDIALLATLVAAAQQDDNFSAPLHVVEPVARPIVDAHLRDAATYYPRIAEVSILGGYQSRHDAFHCYTVS